MKFGYFNLEIFKCFKGFVISIDNIDELCCVCVIVMVKVRVDGYFKWNSFRRGFFIQNDEVIKLYIEVNVEIGKCGYEEFIRFVLMLFLINYQLLFVDVI